tara:strand:+ start:114 stop:485 length:372 start_codon:yes stop_codon:yes gene_type:complete
MSFKKQLLIYSLLLTSNVFSSSENSVNTQWCDSINGISEYRTSYGTYVDCLTDEFAIETEFDFNWKESIGQSLHYAEATNRKPAIHIVIRPQSTVNYLDQLNKTINRFNMPIKIFVTNLRDKR